MFKDDQYKLDLICRSGGWQHFLLYDQGDFTDLCRGPHVDNVKLCTTLQTDQTFRRLLERRQQKQSAAAYLRCMFPDRRGAGSTSESY